MEQSSRRKSKRTKSRQLADCACYDSNNTIFKQTMGRTLNISVSGILLETHSPLETTQPLRLTIGIKENLIEVEGRIVHRKQNERGLFTYGIEFFSIKPEDKIKLTELLKTIGLKDDDDD